MLLIQNRQITRFRYENEKVSSDPSYSLQNEAMEIFLIFFQTLNPLSLFYEL